MENIEFITEEVSKIEKDFKKLNIIEWSESQRQILNYASQMYASVLPLSPLACKGFISLAMRDYQIKKQFDFKDYPSLSPDKQNEVNLETKDLIIMKLGTVLKNPDDISLVEKCVDDAIKKTQETMG